VIGDVFIEGNCLDVDAGVDEFLFEIQIEIQILGSKV
jgi:hypothetical protein